MDPIIKTYPSRSLSSDLWITVGGGIAYQKDMAVSVPYDQAYFEKYVGYENTPVAQAINKARVSLVEERCHCILDVGIGSGEFMRNFSKRSYGFDINKVAVAALERQNSFLDPYENIPDAIDGITLWDTMEHMPRPSDLLLKPRVGVYVFISMPVFSDLAKVFQSKHYRPNEHYYYYTEAGLRKFMADMGYKHLETNGDETEAGREGILSFVFQRETLVNLDGILKRATAQVPAPAPVEIKAVKPMVAPKIQPPIRGPQGFALTSKPAR